MENPPSFPARLPIPCARSQAPRRPCLSHGLRAVQSLRGKNGACCQVSRRGDLLLSKLYTLRIFLPTMQTQRCPHCPPPPRLHRHTTHKAHWEGGGGPLGARWGTWRAGSGRRPSAASCSSPWTSSRSASDPSPRPFPLSVGRRRTARTGGGPRKRSPPPSLASGGVRLSALILKPNAIETHVYMVLIYTWL